MRDHRPVQGNRVIVMLGFRCATMSDFGFLLQNLGRWSKIPNVGYLSGDYETPTGISPPDSPSDWKREGV